MLRQSSVFALALISGAATAGPVANTVNGLLGLGGPTAAPLTAPLSTALNGPASTVDAAAQPVTRAAPLPGLDGDTSAKSGTSPGGTLALAVLDGNNTGNGGAISVAVLSGSNSGRASGSNNLSVGVLNENDPLRINGCMGTTCQGGAAPPVSQLNIGNTLNITLRGLLIPLTTQTLGAVTNPVGSGLQSVVNMIPITGARLFGGPSNDNTTPNSTINAGVLSGNNSGSGGMIGVAVLSTDRYDPAQGANQGNSTNSKAANSTGVSVGVLNGVGPPTGGGGAIVDPGSNPDGNRETAQDDGESELCALLAKDNRGQVKGKLREKAHCQKAKTPKA